jgi:hypothetical protein
MMSGLLTAGFSQSSVNFQNYYVNISRPNGGAANNGDTLEIRGVINVLNGTNFTRVRFLGVVPTGTTYIPGSLQAKTNDVATRSCLEKLINEGHSRRRQGESGRRRSC